MSTLNFVNESKYSSLILVETANVYEKKLTNRVPNTETE